MESIVRKSLNKREKCFEMNSCPIWLLSILPARIKSVESIVDQENNEQQSKFNVDLSPFKFNSSIPLLNEEKILYFNENKSHFEYPNDISFENQFLNNSSQLISSPSNEQLFYLFNQLKQFQKKTKRRNFSKKTEVKCREMNCFNNSIPLTEYCPHHLLENDEKQILFVKCNQCQQISIQEDKKNILHFCSY
jgi:hypothetical protein